MFFYENAKKFYSVLTNGITEFEIYGSRYECSINPASHVFGQDGFGNLYIDGLPAHIEVRFEGE